MSAPSNSPIWNLAIKAGETALIPQDGNNFEVVFASAAVQIRASNNKFGGQFNLYGPGQGSRNLTFSKLEVKNTNPFAIVVSIVVGDANFINHQLTLASNQLQQVVFPTYPKANADVAVAINDLSGGAFVDINGGKWYAVNRVAILVFNLDSGTTTLLVKKNGSAAVPDDAGGVIYPAPLPIRFDGYSGDWAINLGGAAINMIVSEIYNAIPSTS